MRPSHTASRLYRATTPAQLASRLSPASQLAFRRHNSVYNARENLNQLLETSDRSSYILAQYVPEPARDAFLAIRAFSLEINKINDGKPSSTAANASARMKSTLGVSTIDLKFKFWSDLLAKVFQDAHVTGHGTDTLGEPIAVLLRQALRSDLNLDIQYFHQFLQSRRHFLDHKTFKSVDDICSYGEGTYSQLNYLTQGLLLSPSISPSVISLLELSPQLQRKVNDIAAHIGQATAISLMILGLEYYARTRNHVTLPVDVMTAHNLSQEDVLRVTQGHKLDDDAEIKRKLKAVVFDTSVVANDHMLTARSKLADVKLEISDIVGQQPRDSPVAAFLKKWRGGIPDVIFTPYMVGTPTSLYLEKLEKHDFDVFDPRLSLKEWKLAYRSYMNYHRRRI